MHATPRRLVPALLATGGLLLGAVPATTATAAPSAGGCANQNFNDKVDKFLACIDADDALVHLGALQAIADANGGTRASGTPGYDASIDYVQALLDDAGFTTTLQEFDFDTFQVLSESFLVDGVTPPFGTMTGSGSGTVDDANVVSVDLALADPAASSSGCEPTDFDPLDFLGDVDVALMQRGACSFAQKAVNAEAAGAEAAVVFNQGTPDREVLFFGTLGGTVGTIPVFSTDFATGVAIDAGASLSLSAETLSETVVTSNLIADLEGANPDNVVMAGAHLDSVQAGPGIQDNGSGSAAILTVALAMAENKKFVPENSIRFAWWGAEESGLIGSTEYIFNPEFGISDEDYAALALYLNFDMIASPNFIYGVYDADESTYPAADFGVVVPDGSTQLEDLFEAYYTSTDTPYDDSAFSGRSDYQAFINVGIPASGLFTGAEVIKTEEQAGIWGGTVGDQFDPCYHLACDTFDNVSFEALDTNVDAIGYAMFSVALDTSLVNGVEGRTVRGAYSGEFDGPQGTNLEGLGGAAAEHGHDHDHSMGEPS